jgi:SAM-dependent methyltransferase
MSTEDLSERNSHFWNELCGSNLAKTLGILDSSVASLKKFDDWYFGLYPYLFDYIPFSGLKDKSVLEVGLGYGTVSQKLAESGANYTGLDIASGPVKMVNHRLNQEQLLGNAICGSILSPPFEPESFDTIIAIGCLHHTGDLQEAINSCWNLLKPGGSLLFMVYYAYSYRRFCQVPTATISYMLKELSGYRGVVGKCTASEREAYDANSKGVAAPATDWISIRSLESLCSKFSHFSAHIENINQEFPFNFFSREKLLKTPIPQYAGLDIYAKAKR